MKRKLLTTTLSLILFLTFATPAFAQGPTGAQVVLGDNFVLEDEQTLNRDLVVFGGNVTVAASSKIDGDMIVFGGNANIDGTVDGDMVVFGGNANVDGAVAGDVGMIGGNIDLGETAVIEGDIGLVGGRANIADGAVVEGRIRNLTRFDYDYDRGRDDGGVIPAIPPAPPAPDFPGSFDWPGSFRWIGRVIGDIFWTASLLIILGLISWLVAAFMPEQMMSVRRTLTESAPLSFGFGLLTCVIVAISFLLIFTLILILVPFIALFLAGIATLFGWIVIGQIIGERLLVTNGSSQPGLIFSSIVGVAVLTLLANMPVIGQVPCLGFLLSLIGWVVGIIVALTGLGAVLLTRFGTRSYPSSPYSIPGGPAPSRASSVDVSETDLDLGIASASEVELKAKIKAALAEAGEAPDEETPVRAKPAAEEPGQEKPTAEEVTVDEKPADETPDPEEPTPDTTDEEIPDSDPGKKPKTDA